MGIIGTSVCFYNLVIKTYKKTRTISETSVKESPRISFVFEPYGAYAISTVDRKIFSCIFHAAVFSSSFLFVLFSENSEI